VSEREHVLEVDHLEVEFDTYGGVIHAVRDIGFRVRRGRTFAIVGESGCGKSVTVQSLMGLIPMPPGRIRRGSARLDGEEIIGLPESTLNRIRGARIGMIFQDPMTSLNPTMRVGDQIAETLQVHRNMNRREAHRRAVHLLGRSQIPEPAQRARQYPFEFSGGMLQRAMIAVALACEPEILIADEPTTALDVTIQAQILELMLELQRDQGMSIILITHDLGVVARMADDVAVMYAGQIVESGTAVDIFDHAAHPYTHGLRRATPSNDPEREQRLVPIDGAPPDLFQPPRGCAYAARCPYAMRICGDELPPPFEIREPAHARGAPGHVSRCWLQHPEAPRVDPIHQRTSDAA